MKRLFKALKSLRLAIILIAYLAVTGVLASLVPQGRGADFYGSVFFLIPAFLFFANLAACSADRFARELKKGSGRKHGPDILHLGLILLLIGAIGGQVAKQARPSWQGFARLGAGEAVELPNGKLLTLLALESARYADGRPKDWISTVRVSADGKITIPSYEIRVNHPLRLGPLSIYQSSYGRERILELKDGSGARRSFAAGEYIDAGASKLMLMSVDPESGISIARQEDASGSRTISLGVGSTIGPYTVEAAREVELSGLQAAYDPAYPVVIAGFAIALLGTCLTLARKLGEIKA
jgi:hypothetical protein